MTAHPVLHLGVLDIQYTANPADARAAPAKRVSKAKHGRQSPTKSKRPPLSLLNVTTGDVAEILEAKYALFTTFVEAHEADITRLVAESTRDALESLLQGAPATIDPFGAATSSIAQLFRDFLSNKEMDALGIPGVPTKAALDGVNHRKKIKKGDPRPSFIDTGLLEASFEAWVDKESA